jgi:hypothetical protein
LAKEGKEEAVRGIRIKGKRRHKLDRQGGQERGRRQENKQGEREQVPKLERVG